MSTSEYQALRCVHCLQWRSEVNDDHVLPRSWYPDSTPPNTEKWVAPSCIDCNSRLGKIEEELRLKLGLCIDPDDSRASGIYDKALRSLDADAARSEKDAQVRIGKRNKTLRSLFRVPAGQEVKGVFPGFDRPKDEGGKDRVALLVKEGDLRAFTEKIVRGSSHVLDGRYIEQDEQIDFWVPNATGSEAVDQLLAKSGKDYELGPGFTLTRAVAVDRPNAYVCRIRIWGKLTLYATVMPKEPPPIVSGHTSWVQ